jgi:hypothetical protein
LNFGKYLSLALPRGYLRKIVRSRKKVKYTVCKRGENYVEMSMRIKYRHNQGRGKDVFFQR